MVYELMDRLVLGKKYQLQEIYDLIEDYCVDNGIDDWKHKVRAMLEEKNGVRSLGKYEGKRCIIARFVATNFS